MCRTADTTSRLALPRTSAVTESGNLQVGPFIEHCTHGSVSCLPDMKMSCISEFRLQAGVLACHAGSPSGLFKARILVGRLRGVGAFFSILEPGLKGVSSQLGKPLSTTGFRKSTAGKRTLRTQPCKVEARRRCDFRNPMTVPGLLGLLLMSVKLGSRW